MDYYLCPANKEATGPKQKLGGKRKEKNKATDTERVLSKGILRSLIGQ